MEKGLNTELYWKNDDPTHTISMVPTSAITGEGIPDLLLWLVRLTQVCYCSESLMRRFVEYAHILSFHWVIELFSRVSFGCVEAVNVYSAGWSFLLIFVSLFTTPSM